ncbi:hypothetical protein HK104_007731 [Borealophlyctis nickersoniae]|nr:hypothetical protein HK104_007731 [Borealophlyctis nickersoniae]
MKSTALFQQLKAGVEALPEAERNDLIKKTNAVFEIDVTDAQKQEEAWTLDLKKGVVSQGKPEGKADIVINVSDDTFVDLAAGKINGQKAFMQGKLKIKGNMMLATKLDAVLKVAKKAPAPAAASAAPAAAPASAAGGVEVSGFQSSKVFAEIAAGIAGASAAQKDAIKKKANAVFQFDVKNAEGKVQTWTLDLKNNVSIATGAGAAKPDIVISIGDKDFTDLATGKLNGQKAFMQGKLKVKGNMMLATKLDAVLKDLKPKAKL